MIELKGVRKRFGRVIALAGVDVHVRRGEIVGIVGPNGAGKSTLLKILLGLVRADGGMLLLDGVNTRPDAVFRARVGYMPQTAAFPGNLTGEDVLGLLRAVRGRACSDLELIEGLRLGHELTRPLAQLSAGTRQKLNAAAAFAFAPDLLVLDEPTAGLDPLAATALKDKMRRERDRQRMLVVSSHVMAEMEELCDRVVFLSEGEVRFAGSISELHERTGQRTVERAIAALMSEPPA